MKLVNNKKASSSLAVATVSAPAQPALGDLTKLADLIHPVRSRRRDLDAALAALAQARAQLRTAQQAPAMLLTVQHELVVQQGDLQALALFDREHGAALAAEQAAREHALQINTQLPARITALQTIINQLAQQMIADTSISAIEREAAQLFAPFGEALLTAATTYVDALAAARTVAYALERTLEIRETDLFGETRTRHRVELMSQVDAEQIVPDTLGTRPFQTLCALNERLGDIDLELATQLTRQLADAGIGGTPLTMARPVGPYEERQIYTGA